MSLAAKVLIVVVLLLAGFGILFLASASSVKGVDSHHDAHFYVKRQLLWLALALLFGIAAISFDYHWLHRGWANVALVGGSVVLLLLVFIPPFGVKAGGSHRWIRFAFVSVQPSEVAKIAVIVMLASWMTMKGRYASRFKEGLIYPCLGLGLILGLIFIEPDFGTTLLTALVAAAIMFVGGTRPSHLIATGAVGLFGFGLAILHDPERLGRILSFIMRQKYPDEAYQLTQSETALALGGAWGAGLGESVQKHYFLPEAHTDFIFAIIGEELGLWATCTILALFAALFVCGTIITLKARDQFGRLLAFGLTLMLTLEAVINIGVVTGCLPTKGLALPFISYGGSSLIVSMLAVGMLVNVAAHNVSEDEHTRVVGDLDHWA